MRRLLKSVVQIWHTLNTNTMELILFCFPSTYLFHILQTRSSKSCAPPTQKCCLNLANIEHKHIGTHIFHFSIKLYPSHILQTGGLLSELYGRGGLGVYLADGQTETEEVTQGGRGDALLRRLPPYLIYTDPVVSWLQNCPPCTTNLYA